MILVSGEALIDLIPVADEDGRYDAVRGGSPYNVAIGLARLGAPTAFVSRLSADANGESLAAALAADGVDLSLAERDKRPTTLAFVMRGTAQTGSRYSFYLDATSFDGAWPFPATWPAKARHLHVGSISAVDPRHGERVVAALARAKGALTTSFDPNIRPLVTPDRASVVALVERQVALASIAKASDEDLEWLYPGRPIEETLKLWSTLGPRFCVATLGGRGAFAYIDGERLERRAGQSGRGRHRRRRRQFHVGAAGGDGPRRRAGARARPTPSRERLAAWLAFAAAASAFTCTRKGSDPPTRREMAALGFA